ncbi:PEP-CTERM sorting domain-containing protein [Massilia yuzhufengensis]|uniref:VPLPA-CTERM protein sorting domain-containing protein n=1 Tax=Massilia yuzhufengensis TaxID=1164594 RepID=A0A1I1DST5_9BURK|nr:PEP-CTERM sorting domain-containing protein [Massilia yuzhufengensis]SFB75623.1 VPLPA-CTERM protein sorting domain-containing protein [Massilia yuzhufengensis]
MNSALVLRALAACVLGSFMFVVHAAPVLVFDNGSIVDTSDTNEAESDTLQAALIDTGNPVTTFTATDAAGITAALAGQTVLVIPEQENGSLIDALDESARNVLRNFVAGGGGLIIAADFRDTLNTLFGFSLVFDLADTSTLRPAAIGTTFAGGPATLPPSPTTGGFQLSSLPPGARSIYDDLLVSTVTLFNFGSGQIVQLGWDFFDAAPLGTQNEGWLEVLDRAVAQVDGDPTNPPDPPNGVPEPGSVSLIAAALGAFAVARRRRY